MRRIPRAVVSLLLCLPAGAHGQESLASSPLLEWQEAMGEKLDVSWAPESLCRAYFSSGHVGASGDVLFTDLLSGLRDSPARRVRLDDVVIVGAAQTETHVGVAETVTIHAFFEAGRDLLLAACIEPHFVQHPLGSVSPLSTAREAIARPADRRSLGTSPTHKSVPRGSGPSVSRHCGAAKARTAESGGAAAERRRDGGAKR
jgi:hypothetical protein